MVANNPLAGGNDVDIRVNITTDQQRLRQTENSVKAFNRTLKDAFALDDSKNQAAMKRVQSGLKEITREARGTTDVYRAWGKVLADIDRQNTIAKLTKELVTATRSGKDLAATIERVKAGLQDIGASQGEVAGVVGAAQAAGGGGGLGGRISRLGQAARVGLPSVPIAGTSTDQIARVVQAVGVLGPALLPVSAGIVALGVAVIGLKIITADAEKAINAAIKSQEQYYRAIQDGTRDSVRTQIEALQADIAVKRATIADNQRFFKAMEDQVGGVGRAFFDIFNIGGTGSLRGSTQEAEASLFEMEATLRALENASNSAEVATNTLNAALEAYAEKTIQSQLSALSLTADGIQSRVETLSRENQKIKEFLDSGQAVGDLYDELNDKMRDNGIELTALFNALPGAQAQKRMDDARKALEDIGAGAVRIQEQSEARIVQINEQGAKQIESAEKHLSDARVKLVEFNADLEDKRAKIDSDFMKADLERLDDFHQKAAKLTRDANKETLRDLQDHRDRLLEAEIDNNVAAFLAEQSAFKKDQARKAEDERVAASDRLDALEAEREKARELRKERLDALDVEAAKKRADLQDEINERATALETIKQQIADRVQAEKDAQIEALRNLVAQYDPAVNHMIQTTTQGFAIIEQSGIRATQSIGTALDELQRRANLNYLPSATSSPVRQALSFLPGLSSGISFKKPIAFAGGGMAPANQLVNINDGGGTESGLNSRGQLAVFSTPTRVFSAADTARLLSGSKGGSNITFIHNGDIRTDERMTRSEFKIEMTAILQEQAQGFVGARQGRLAS